MHGVEKEGRKNFLVLACNIKFCGQSMKLQQIHRRENEAFNALIMEFTATRCVDGHWLRWL